jgi:hypothetical protein
MMRNGSKDSLDDVCRGMLEMQERLIRNRDVRSYRETAEQLYKEKTQWMKDAGHVGMAVHYDSWISIYDRLFPLPKKETL